MLQSEEKKNGYSEIIFPVAINWHSSRQTKMFGHPT